MICVTRSGRVYRHINPPTVTQDHILLPQLGLWCQWTVGYRVQPGCQFLLAERGTFACDQSSRNHVLLPDNAEIVTMFVT